MDSFSSFYMRFCASGLPHPLGQESQVRGVEGRHSFISFCGAYLLKCFSGKVMSFSLAIPGCKLYVRGVFKAASRLSGSTQPSIKVEAALRAEIEYWRFLDNWRD